MNKVFVFTVAALLACPASMNAQEASSSEGVRFGLKLAPNMGFVRPETDGLESNGSGFGYTFGLIAEFPIGGAGNYRFATGLFLNNITGKWKEKYPYYELGSTTMKTKDLESDVKLQYIELPVTIKMMTNEIGYIRYYGQIGFGNGFNIRAKSDQVVPTVNGSFNGEPIVTEFVENKNEDIQSDIMLYKASLIVGAGMEYNFSGNTSLLVGITYNNGFTNILDIEGAKAKAHYLELTTGIFF